KNPSYSKHLFGKSESALKDIMVKLPWIIGPKKYVAFFLIGFDSCAIPMDREIERLSELAQLSFAPWTLVHRSWPNCQDAAYRARCWCWFRRADNSLPAPPAPNVSEE